MPLKNEIYLLCILSGLLILIIIFMLFAKMIFYYLLTLCLFVVISASLFDEMTNYVNCNCTNKCDYKSIFYNVRQCNVHGLLCFYEEKTQVPCIEKYGGKNIKKGEQLCKH